MTLWILEVALPDGKRLGESNISTHRKFSEIQKGREQERSSY
jgi:hypothetical protein